MLSTGEFASSCGDDKEDDEDEDEDDAER